MFETNFIKFIRSFEDIPVYAFVIPEEAPETAYCFEPAGKGYSQLYYGGEEIESRTIKLTKSSNDISQIWNDSSLHKYIRQATHVGDLQILCARILGVADNFSADQKLYERTYTINIKLKGN
ncbi:MAG: hypothetical protein ACRC2Y_04840 [Aeromonas veronii]